MSDASEKLKEWRASAAYRLLHAEIAELEKALPEDEALPPLLRDRLNRSDETLLAFYEHILNDMREGSFHLVVPTDPLTEADRLGASLISLNKSLDRRFAEIRALNDVTRTINQGLFLEDVLNHVYDTFRQLIPYDRIGFALIEDGPHGKTVRAHWARSDFPEVMIYRNYTLPLAATSLGVVAESGKPRIINDLEAYLAAHPHSDSTKRIVHEGARSSLTCPLIVKGRVTGFMFFSSRYVGTYEANHIDAFLELAGQMAVTLEKSRLYEDLTSRNEFIRRVFGRYLSDELAEMLLSDPEALKLGGTKQMVTVLMSDLRGFTTMSERKPPEVVVAALNNHLEHMIPVIQAHGGTIDNIIGDAVMVLFGTPLKMPDDARRAVACGLAMQAAMAEVNRINVAQGLPELAMGIGINTGRVVAGNIGSESHMKYSVIGAPVNLAARIEAHSKAGEVLVTASTIEACGPGLTLGEKRAVTAKGIDGLVAVFPVLRLDNF